MKLSWLKLFKSETHDLQKAPLETGGINFSGRHLNDYANQDIKYGADVQTHSLGIQPEKSVDVYGHQVNSPAGNKELFHHIISTDTTTHHKFSLSPDPNDRGVAGLMVEHYKNYPDWKGVPTVKLSHTDEPGFGFGSSLYKEALKHHGKLQSDSMTSPSANKTWDKIISSPDVTGEKGTIGAAESRHMAEYTPKKLAASEDLKKAPVEYITDPQETHKKIPKLNETYPIINKVNLPNGLVYQQHMKRDFMGPVHVHHLYHPNSDSPVAEVITRPDEDNPMNHKVQYSQVSPEHKGKGLGKQAYLAALVHGKGIGRMLSDNQLSRNAHRMWTSLKGIPGLGGKIGRYVTTKQGEKSPAVAGMGYEDQHQVFVKNKKGLDHNAMFPPIDMGGKIKETKLAASEDLNKSKTFKTGVSGVSSNIGLERLKQIKQDNYVGAGGKDYDPDELHQRMFEIGEKQAAKQSLFPEQESEKTHGSFEQIAPPMPGKKMFGKSDLITPMIEKDEGSNNPENTRLLYHGAPSKIYDKIKNEGFKLTSGKRSGSFGVTKEVQNQGIFLSDTPAVAHFFGHNRTGHESGYTHNVHEVNTALGNNLDLTQKWPSTLKKIGLNLKQKYDGSKSIKRNDIYWLLDKPEFVSHIKDLGYHSVKFLESKSLETTHKLPPSNTYMVFDPNRLSIANNLGKSETLEKAIHPKDFKPIQTSHSKGLNEGVDHAAQIADHPVHASYKEHISEGPTPYKARKLPRDSSSGIATKTIHDLTHYINPEGHTISMYTSPTFMTKPYHGHLESATKNYTKHKIKGWATLTTKDLLHAAGMGHMAEDVRGHIHEGVPVTVHKFSDNHEPLVNGEQQIHPGDAQRIAVMDFLTGNNDRHVGNIMVSKQKNEDGYYDPLLIDHERNFQYERPISNKFGKLEHGHTDSPANTLLNSTGLNKVSYQHSPNTMSENTEDLHGWWHENGPKVREAFNKNINHIKDPHLKSHIENNFNQRMAHLEDNLIDGNYYDMFRYKAKNPNTYSGMKHEKTGLIDGVKVMPFKKPRGSE